MTPTAATLAREIAKRSARLCKHPGASLYDDVACIECIAHDLESALTTHAQQAAAAMREHPHEAVRQFHEAFGVALGGSWWSPARRALRQRLIVEEFNEWHAAEAADDPAATLDAIVDLVYVLVGAALEYGMDFAGAFAAVHAANMVKLGPDGKPIIRDDGKVLKPDGWKAADLTPYLPLDPREEG